MLLIPREMIVALNIIFTLFILMIIRQIWLLRKEKKKKEVSYFKYPLTMSIGERMRRKRLNKW